jgi:hypothetical protein
MKNIIFLSLLLCFTVYSQTAERIAGSPYPVSTKPDTLYTISDVNYTESQLVTIQTLQGILAQTKPRIYRFTPNSAYGVWLADLKANYGVTVSGSYDGDFAGMIKLFKNEIKGYIICNVQDNSVNVAISLCGITQSVAVTSDNAYILSGLGIPMYADVRGKDENWFFDNYGSQVNKNIFCFQKENMDKFLADYSVFGKMITFYNPAFDSSTNKIFASFNPNSVLLGWGFDEYQLVAQGSSYNTFTHAADYSINLSTLSNFSAVPKQKSDVDTIQTKENTHTVCFLMTDGDNIQWAVGGLFTGNTMFASSDRGRVRLGWTISPALAELAPTAMKYIYNSEISTSTGRDYFVSGPSGVGYMYPDKYHYLDEYASITNEYMKKADLRITNVIGNNDSVKYVEPFLKQSNIDAVFYYYYTDYSGGHGKIAWIDNKPVIYGRYNLADGGETATTLAQKLNASSTNTYSSDSYSLIPVNVWSRSVSDVVNCAKQLNSNIRVVTPDEFVSLINKNLSPRSSLVQIIPNNGSGEQAYLVPGDTGSAHNTTKRWADYNTNIIYKFNLDTLLAMSNSTKDLLISFLVANEFIISASNSLDSSWTEMFRWNQDSTVHIHNMTNYGTLTTSLQKYYDKGWHDLYIKFEDGIKSDAYGASVFKVSITAPQTTVTGVKTTGLNVPAGFKLEQNYPNPFNPSTRISYQIPNAGHVTLKVYDVLGREVSTLINNEQSAGSHEVIFNASKLGSGIYFCRLQSGNYISVKKMVLMK